MHLRIHPAILAITILSALSTAGAQENVDSFLQPLHLDVVTGENGHAAGGAGRNFEKGSWSAFAAFGYQDDFGREDAQFVHGTVSLGYFFHDAWSINGEIAYYETKQPGHDPYAGGFNAMLRWHFFRDERFSAFVESGGGVSYFDKKFPVNSEQMGTHFNWVYLLGLGVTYEFADDLHLIGGARYWHLSNAQVHGEDENPSFDGIGPYVGLMWTF